MKWKYIFQSQQYIEKELVTVNIRSPLCSRKPEACSRGLGLPVIMWESVREQLEEA